MHPSVVRQTLDPDGGVPKCPICGMPLSLRKKGEAPKLAPGVLSRKQYSPEQILAAGISTVEVAYRPLEKVITTVGYVTYDESKRSRIVVRASGYLEKLYVDKPWITVNKGEPLGEIYSPELYSAARELLVAMEGGRSNDLVQEPARNCGCWGSATARSTRSSSRARPTGDSSCGRRSPGISFARTSSRVCARRSGTDAVRGGRPVDRVDRSRGLRGGHRFLAEGTSHRGIRRSLSGRVFAAKVSLVHPHMDTTTRTNAVRFELANPHHELRPGMFATVRIKTPLSEIEPFPKPDGEELVGWKCGRSPRRP